MSIERLVRVMWRLAKCKHPTRDDLDQAIMRECGTDDRTLYMNRKALKRLKWITYSKGKALKVTGEHLRD